MTDPERPVLYIERDRKTAARLDLLRRLRPETALSGQDGFFRAALHCGFDVTEKPLPYVWRHGKRIGKRFDWLIVNYKAGAVKRGLTTAEIDRIARVPGCRKAVFLNYASAAAMPSNRDLDAFDLVFKRETLKDTERYDLSPANRAKLCTTMLACPLVPATRRNVRRLDPAAAGFPAPSAAPGRDVYFCGADTNPMRRDVIRRLREASLDLDGGLQARNGREPPPADMLTARLSVADYVNRVRNSKVNIALEGIGEFTFRHLELWCCAAFCLSSSSIRNVQLPLDAREGEHYACFDTLDDLVDKVRYYLDHPAERDRIARAGRDLFARQYRFDRHAQYIRSCMEQQP